MKGLPPMPGVQRFHPGGDEASTLGKHPDTAAYAKQFDKAALYMRHVQPLMDHLNERWARPML